MAGPARPGCRVRVVLRDRRRTPCNAVPINPPTVIPQTHEAILFRADIQYALNLEPAVEITQRTIERYLQKIQNEEGLSDEIFARVTETLLQSMEITVRKQRLDSTHVLSDMAVLGRSQMMGVALRRFFHQLRKHDESLFEQVPEEIRRRYCKQSDSRVFADANTSEKRQASLRQAGEDMACVPALFAAVQPVGEWDIFRQLQTIFDQQCEVREEFVETRKKTGGAVIQNPSDPDATCDGHKGAGAANAALCFRVPRSRHDSSSER